MMKYLFQTFQCGDAFQRSHTVLLHTKILIEINQIHIISSNESLILNKL